MVLTCALYPAKAFADEEEDALSVQESEVVTTTPEQAGETYVEGELLVTFKESVSGDEALSLLESGSDEGLSVLSSESEQVGEAGEEENPIVLVDLEDGVSVEEAIDQFEQDPLVEHAQPNYLYYLLDDVDNENVEEVYLGEAYDYAYESDDPGYATLTTKVNDPYANVSNDSYLTPNQWWLSSVGIPNAWDRARANKNVTIAIIDTGINFLHDDLKGNINTALAYDAVEETKLTTNPTADGMAHGTHVAGIAAAQANNGKQFAGASYNANILPINVFYYSSIKRDYVSNSATLIGAYQYLEKLIKRGTLKDLHVINMSLGGETNEDVSLRKQIAAMNARNVLTVCAAGNTGRGVAVYPSDYPECLSVTAIDSGNARAYFSSYGNAKDIAAPGVDIWSTWINGSTAYRCEDGTSMAAPIVSGIAALMWAYKPDLTVRDARDILCSTATDLGTKGHDPYFGWGKVNANAALKALATNPGSSKALSGTTRYGTMYKSVNAYQYEKNILGKTTNTVIIASGQQFPDALSASALAGVRGAPILLTEPNYLPTETTSLLMDIEPSRIIIVGGTSAVSSGVAFQIRNAAGTDAVISRVSGSDRIQTALKIYDAGKTSWGKTAIVASSASFADSLSMSPYAYKTKSPIFLVDPKSGKLTSEAMKRLTAGKFTQIIIVGGTAAVPSSVTKQLKAKKLNVVRWQGSDRYQTSQAIARNSVKAGVLNARYTGIATGEVFADALSAGSLLGLQGGPLVLMAHSKAGLSATGGFLTEQKGTIRNLTFFGGTAALPQSVKTAAQKAAGI